METKRGKPDLAEEARKAREGAAKGFEKLLELEKRRVALDAETRALNGQKGRMKEASLAADAQAVLEGKEPSADEAQIGKIERRIEAVKAASEKLKTQREAEAAGMRAGIRNMMNLLAGEIDAGRMSACAAAKKYFICAFGALAAAEGQNAAMGTLQQFAGSKMGIDVLETLRAQKTMPASGLEQLGHVMSQASMKVDVASADELIAMEALMRDTVETIKMLAQAFSV